MIERVQGNVVTAAAEALMNTVNCVGYMGKGIALQFKKAFKAIQNIHANLNSRGLYVFDIFNLSYLLKDDNIVKLTIDVQTKMDDTTARQIQYSTISSDGVLVSYDICHEQKGHANPKASQPFQALQVYNKTQLREMLERNGFKVIKQCDIDGSKFHETKTERILTIAKKAQA